MILSFYKIISLKNVHSIFRIKAWLFSHIFLKNIVYFFQQMKIYYFFLYLHLLLKKILFRILL